MRTHYAPCGALILKVRRPSMAQRLVRAFGLIVSMSAAAGFSVAWPRCGPFEGVVSIISPLAREQPASPLSFSFRDALLTKGHGAGEAALFKTTGNHLSFWMLPSFKLFQTF